jgi:hypothetical protein
MLTLDGIVKTDFCSWLQHHSQAATKAPDFLFSCEVQLLRASLAEILTEGQRGLIDLSLVCQTVGVVSDSLINCTGCCRCSLTGKLFGTLWLLYALAPSDRDIESTDPDTLYC